MQQHHQQRFNLNKSLLVSLIFPCRSWWHKSLFLFLFISVFVLSEQVFISLFCIFVFVLLCLTQWHGLAKPGDIWCSREFVFLSGKDTMSLFHQKCILIMIKYKYKYTIPQIQSRKRNTITTASTIPAIQENYQILSQKALWFLFECFAVNALN